MKDREGKKLGDIEEREEEAEKNVAGNDEER